MAQQILKEVDGSFKSFFGLLKLAKQGKYPFSSCRLPKYLPKDGYATLIVGFVRLNGNRFVLPYSAAYKKHHKPVTITIRRSWQIKPLKRSVSSKADASPFEIQYTYQVEAAQRNLNPTHALAIDFGIDNLMTAVSNRGESFLIDGKRLNPSTSGSTSGTPACRASKTSSTTERKQPDVRPFCRGRETTRSVTTWVKQRNRWSPTASGTISEP